MSQTQPPPATRRFPESPSRAHVRSVLPPPTVPATTHSYNIAPGDVLAHLRSLRLRHLDDQQRRRIVGQRYERENIALTQDGGFNGTVTGSNSNPLQGVTVTCNGCGVSSATTAADGTYASTNIAPGTYSLTFSDTGYVTQTISRSGRQCRGQPRWTPR